MSVNQGLGSLSRDDRSSSSLGGGVPRSLCATSSASLMMGVEAADGVRVQAAQRCRIELQRALGLLGRSFEKRFDQRDEMSAEVLENHDATGNIAGQQRRAMTASGAGAARKEQATHSFAKPEAWSTFSSTGLYSANVSLHND
jgi:hypothetical protein